METNPHKNLYKICLTGGPCAGKTTALTKLMEKFSTDFIVYCVPEVATMTFSSGVTIIPSEFTPQTHKAFTQGICQMQIDIEKYYETIASIQKRPVLMIIDRGVADNFAYASTDTKKAILNSTGWNTNYLINERYDLVLHLVTAALGAEEFYGTGAEGNNVARSEPKDLAIEMDEKIRKQWMGHPNFKIIDNSQTGFKAKMERVVNAVSQLTGVSGKTFAKKLLLKRSYTNEELSKHGKVITFEDTITYLVNNKKERLDWIVKRVYKNNPYPAYFRVDRTLDENVSKRIETHKMLSERNYFDVVSRIDKTTRPLTKKISTFQQSKDHQVIQFLIEHIKTETGEINVMRVYKDMEEGGEIFVPDFLEVEKDVTEDPTYFTQNLALIK